MNNSINILSKRILPASLSALAVLLLASCADESTPASADKLPAEVRFTAALGAPLTRATTSGVWETGELVAVEIGSERKQYVVRTADGTMSGNGEANTYYWMTPNDAPKNVTAWHLGQWNGAEAAQVDMACPGTFSVSTDQTAGTAASDFVYAPLQTISFGGNSTLKFYHQLALLTIRLDLEQGHISKLLIGTDADPVAVGGDFTAPSGGSQVFGAWDTTSGATGVVSACRLASSGKEGYPLCYQCVMLPQDRQGKPFITVVLTSGERYTWTDTENCTKWAPGVSYSYNFRLRNGLIENVTDEERLKNAINKSKVHNITIVLKGHHTMTVRPDGKVYINSSGNPGMATAGSGDVLTGIISGLIAQGYSADASVWMGVYIHGHAGDLAAGKLGEYSLIASDIIDNLGPAILDIKRQ